MMLGTYFPLIPTGGKQMDKKIAGLLGAAAALTTMSAAQSAVAEPIQNEAPASYRDLLEPVPDALNALKADDARIAAAKTQGGERVPQYYYHHHHHHHQYYGDQYYGGGWNTRTAAHPVTRYRVETARPTKDRAVVAGTAPMDVHPVTRYKAETAHRTGATESALTASDAA
jgi:hypothetical protein